MKTKGRIANKWRIWEKAGIVLQSWRAKASTVHLVWPKGQSGSSTLWYSWWDSDTRCKSTLLSFVFRPHSLHHIPVLSSLVRWRGLYKRMWPHKEPLWQVLQWCHLVPWRQEEEFCTTLPDSQTLAGIKRRECPGGREEGAGVHLGSSALLGLGL